MRKLNIKQISAITAIFILFAVASGFVYLKQLRIEMTVEAGLVSGTIIDRQQQYFNLYGEFTALEERSNSEVLKIDLKENKYFTSMRIEVMGNTLMLYAKCPKGFFKGTQLYVKYNNLKGVTYYEIQEKTKIPLARL
ncbi:MAG: hypothetical protein LBD46_06320 [Endomicrobium sp.]|jgi:hypothetical protein|nr:hypothetical protein [Endomicrobium sp.]